jgi:rubrerythrin
MSDPQTYEELLEFALEREIQAIEYYTDAADKMGDSKSKTLFELLAIEEQRHQALLEFELLKTGKVISNTENILTLSDLELIVEIPDTLRQTYLDILKEAMRREDKAFKVYVDLMAKAPSPETRIAAANLAQEEVRHKLLLEIRYQRELVK